jgi:hypothetical protein
MFRPSKLLVVLLVLIFATAAFAFAATNTVPGTYAGEGAEDISGYEVLTVDYNLSVANPSNISSVDLTLDAAASDVKISVVNGGTVYDCSGAGTNWTCDTTAGTQATVSAANQLRVIAVD